jgi:hypothetical protein
MIKSCRDEIVERQNQIAELEKQMNEIYEEAADGMNLLEEHGIKVDISDPEKWDERMQSDEFSIEYPFNPNDFTIPYDSYDSTSILNPDPSAWTSIASRMCSVDGISDPCQIVCPDEDTARIVRESLASDSNSIGVSSAS